MEIKDIFPQTLFRVFGIPIRDTVVHTWVVMVVLVGLALVVHRRYRVWAPAKWQLALEYLVEYMEDLISGIGGRPIPEIVPYLTTMIAFIAISDLLGLIPLLRAPTRDLNTTMALSIISLISTQYYGVQRQGLLRHLHNLADPVFMLPLNLLSLASRALSMGVRLFGNIMAGEIIGGGGVILVPVLAPLPMYLLSMITSVLQALVFTVLTLVFVVDAIGSQETQLGSTPQA